MSARRKLWLALITVYVLWGSTYLSIRVAVRTLPPFLMAATRFLVAGLILLALTIRRGDRTADPIGARQWGAAAIVGTLLLLGGNGLVSWSERRIDSGVAALIVATVPIWMAVFAATLGAERLRARTVAGLALGFAGVALLIRSAGSDGGPVDLLGGLGVVLASLLWAFGSILSRRLSLPKRPLVATSMEMLAGGAALALTGLLSGELRGFSPSQVSLESLLGLGYLIVFGSWAAFSAYVWLLANARPSLVSTYAYVNPVIAVFLGWLILHEPVTPLTLLAAAVIVGAVAVIVRSEPAREARRSRRREGAEPAERALAGPPGD